MSKLKKAVIQVEAVVPECLVATIGSDEARASEAHNLQRLSIRYTRLQVWLSGTALFIAAISAIFAYKAFDSANRNFVEDKRAWVGPNLPVEPENETSGSVITDPVVGQRMELRIPWRNFGGSPAIHAREHIELRTFSGEGGGDRALWHVQWNDLARELDSLTALDPKESTIFPGEVIQSVDRYATGLLTAEQVAHILDERDLFVIIGSLTYQDVLSSARHVTPLCYIYAPPSEGKHSYVWECPTSLAAN